VVLDPPLADRTPVDPALAPPDEVLPVGLTLLPFEVAELDAEELDADELRVDGRTLADVDLAGVALDVGVVIGLGVDVPQGFPVVAAVVSPGMLLFAAAEADAEADAEAIAAAAVVVGVLVVLPVALGIAVLVGVVLSVGLALLLVGLAPVLLLAGLVGLVAGTGVTLRLGDVLALCEGDDDEVDAHAVTCALLARLLRMLAGLAPPAEEPIGLLLDPFVPWDPLLLWELIPTAEPSWTKAWRSGGTARATPTANTAQATARPDRSNPYRQSRGWRRA